MPTRHIYSQRQWSLVSTLALVIGLCFSSIPNISKFKQPEFVSWLLHAVTNAAYKTPIVNFDSYSDIAKTLDNVKPLNPAILPDSYLDRVTVPELAPLRNFMMSKYELSHNDTVEILASVVKYSEKYKIEPDLILGIIRVESSFISDAQSYVGARGLMQVMPNIHKSLVVQEGGNLEDLWRPTFNIKIGTMILKQMLRASSGDIEDALARYNGSYGMNNGYAEKVLSARVYFRKYTKYLKAQ